MDISKYELYEIDFVILFDGTLILPLPNHLRIRITPEDKFGESLLLCEKGSRIVEWRRGSTQTCINSAYSLLHSDFRESKPFWSNAYVDNWKNKDASEKQKKYISFLYQNEVESGKLTLNKLTKREASCLIELRAS